MTITDCPHSLNEEPAGLASHCVLVEQLKAWGACRDAIAWAEGQPDTVTAWAACDRGD